MARYTHDVIIIGGGAAGLSAASGCAQLGMRTALVEPGRTGGDCLYYGCVPSKSLLRTAAAAAAVRNAHEYGLDSMSYARKGNPVDFSPVSARIKGIIDSIAPHDSPERFRSLGVEMILQKAVFMDSRTLQLAEGRLVSAKNIVLATGSRPRILPIPGIEEAGYITNLDVFSLKKLPSSLVVIGGGPIGMEIGQAMTRLGVKVTILEAGPHILPREDPDMAAIIRERLEKEGASVLEGSGAAAAGAKVKDGLKIVSLKDGSQVEAEEILMAAGRIGNTENLNIEASGVKVEKGYFTVDNKLRTSVKHILAIGDCNGKYQFTHAAGAEASLLVKRLALRLPGSMNYSSIPWVTYTEPELASAGLNEMRAKEAGIEYSVVSAEMTDSDRARAEGETAGKMKILYNRKKQVLGVQIAGPHAGEMLMPGVMACSEKWKLGKFLKYVYPYPTVSEMYKIAAGRVLGPALFNDRVRKILRIIFRYRGTGPVKDKRQEVKHE